RGEAERRDRPLPTPRGRCLGRLARGVGADPAALPGTGQEGIAKPATVTQCPAPPAALPERHHPGHGGGPVEGRPPRLARPPPPPPSPTQPLHLTAAAGLTPASAPARRTRGGTAARAGPRCRTPPAGSASSGLPARRRTRPPSRARPPAASGEGPA